MPPAPSPDPKASLRSAIRRDLECVSSEQASSAGHRIEMLVRPSPFWRRASQIVLFASLPGEVDTGPLMRAALEEGKSLVLPRTRSAGRLEFAKVGGEGELARGAFGILEPARDSQLVEIDRESLLLLPGIAFDRSGGRLGRGGGYYDRVLARLRAEQRRPHCVGVGFALQIVDRVPMTSLDERLDGFVTEQELWRVG